MMGFERARWKEGESVRETKMEMDKQTDQRKQAD